MTLPIGAAIRHIRTKVRKLSSTHVAAKAGMARTHLSRVENRRAIPDIETFVRIARGLDVKPGKLLEFICEHELPEKRSE